MGMIVKVKVAQIHQTSIKLQILRGRLLVKGGGRRRGGGCIMKLAAFHQLSPLIRQGV